MVVATTPCPAACGIVPKVFTLAPPLVAFNQDSGFCNLGNIALPKRVFPNHFIAPWENAPKAGPDIPIVKGIVKLVSPLSQSIVCAFHAPPVANSPTLSAIDHSATVTNPCGIMFLVTNRAAGFSIFLVSLVTNLLFDPNKVFNLLIPPTALNALSSSNNGPKSAIILPPPSTTFLVVLFLPNVPFLKKLDSMTCSGTV